MNNYPDDIRAFDNHPDSPLYDNSAQERLQEKADELFKEVYQDRKKSLIAGLKGASMGNQEAVMDLTDAITESSDMPKLCVALGNYMANPNRIDAEYIARRIEKMFCDYWLDNQEATSELEEKALDVAENGWD